MKRTQEQKTRGRSGTKPTRHNRSVKPLDSRRPPPNGAEKNRYGLSRYIPKPIEKQVRRRCGFGCVICGTAIFIYEHFDPPFRDARQHNANGITLLCGHHELEATKGLLSKDTIRQADKNPLCRQLGYAKCIFDIGNGRPRLLLAGNDFTQCGPRIELDGETLFEVFPPEPKSHRWRLSAQFKDASGQVICEIKQNELVVNSANFDIEQTATRFKVIPDQDAGHALLELEIRPSENALMLQRYVMVTKRGKITIGEQTAMNPFLLAQGVRTEAMVTFESESGRQSFANCKFDSPNGINFRFVNGGLQFGP